MTAQNWLGHPNACPNLGTQHCRRGFGEYLEAEVQYWEFKKDLIDLPLRETMSFLQNLVKNSLYPKLMKKCTYHDVSYVKQNPNPR